MIKICTIRPRIVCKSSQDLEDLARGIVAFISAHIGNFMLISAEIIVQVYMQYKMKLY